MNYGVKELLLAEDLIRDTLTLLNSKGVLDVDLEQVDFSRSAFNALGNECLNGPEEEDRSDSGLLQKGMRFVSCTVYLDGSSVLGEYQAGVEALLQRANDSLAYWGEDSPVEDAWSGKKQVVHSDLMMTTIKQIKPNTELLEFRKGVPSRRFMIERVEYDTNLIWFIDLSDWSRGVLEAANYGIVPYKTGLWNVVNWLEIIDMLEASEQLV